MKKNNVNNIFVEKWENHADVETVRWIQARNKGDVSTPTENMSSEGEESDDERLTESSESAVNNPTESSNEENDVPLVANKFSLLSAE